MRICFLIAASISFLLCGGSVTQAQSKTDVINAFDAGFKTRQQFDSVFKFVLPSAEDEKWRQVPWVPGLWEGIQAAEKANKPMFIWAMNGDPLGCV